MANWAWFRFALFRVAGKSKKGVASPLAVLLTPTSPAAGEREMVYAAAGEALLAAGRVAEAVAPRRNS